MDGSANGNQSTIQAPVRQVLRVELHHFIMILIHRFGQVVDDFLIQAFPHIQAERNSQRISAGGEAKLSFFHLLGHKPPPGQQFVELGYFLIADFHRIHRFVGGNILNPGTGRPIHSHSAAFLEALLHLCNGAETHIRNLAVIGAARFQQRLYLNIAFGTGLGDIDFLALQVLDGFDSRICGKKAVTHVIAGANLLNRNGRNAFKIPRIPERIFTRIGTVNGPYSGDCQIQLIYLQKPERRSRDLHRLLRYSILRQVIVPYRCQRRTSCIGGRARVHRAKGKRRTCICRCSQR